MNTSKKGESIINTAQSLQCFFVSDLHGQEKRYRKLFERLHLERPDALFLGGDLLPSPFLAPGDKTLNHYNFIKDYLIVEFKRLKTSLGNNYPEIFVILGNDDGRLGEETMRLAETQGLWKYCHCRPIKWREFMVYGYSYIPPTPFRLKDWERYDINNTVTAGCIALRQGIFTVQVSEHHLDHATIAQDLAQLTAGAPFERSIFLFHSPPYSCHLDRASLRGRFNNQVPHEANVGSRAIQEWIAKKQPLLTLHGHIHESTRLTGFWREKFNHTESFNAAHDGPELCLIRFNPHQLASASRELL